MSINRKTRKQNEFENENENENEHENVKSKNFNKISHCWIEIVIESTPIIDFTCIWIEKN